MQYTQGYNIYEQVILLLDLWKNKFPRIG